MFYCILELIFTETQKWFYGDQSLISLVVMGTLRVSNEIVKIALKTNTVCKVKVLF